MDPRGRGKGPHSLCAGMIGFGFARGASPREPIQQAIKWSLYLARKRGGGTGRCLPIGSAFLQCQGFQSLPPAPHHWLACQKSSSGLSRPHFSASTHLTLLIGGPASPLGAAAACQRLLQLQPGPVREEESCAKRICGKRRGNFPGGFRTWLKSVACCCFAFTPVSNDHC